MIGFGFGAGARCGGIFTPAVLNLTSWCRASYSAAPWVGNASLGTSGSTNYVGGGGIGGSDPAVGSAVNGLTPADFIPASLDLFVTTSGASLLFSSTAWSIVVLAYVDAVSVITTGTVGVHHGEVISTSQIGIGTWNNSGNKVFVWQNDGTPNFAETAISTSAWQLIQAKYDSTNIMVRVNSGSWVSTACGNPTFTADSVGIGVAISGAVFFDGQILEAMTSQTTFSDETFDNIRTYLNNRYALSL